MAKTVTLDLPKYAFDVLNAAFGKPRSDQRLSSEYIKAVKKSSLLKTAKKASEVQSFISSLGSVDLQEDKRYYLTLDKAAASYMPTACNLAVAVSGDATPLAKARIKRSQRTIHRRVSELLKEDFKVSSDVFVEAPITEDLEEEEEEDLVVDGEEDEELDDDVDEEDIDVSDIEIADS